MPPHVRAQLGAFKGSSFDRGHLSAAADHAADADARRDSFSLANVAPQVGVVVRGLVVRRLATPFDDRAVMWCAYSRSMVGPLYGRRLWRVFGGTSVNNTRALLRRALLRRKKVGVGFNRDYWARLERWTRELTAECDAVHVVTGVLFLPAAREATAPSPTSQRRADDDDGPASEESSEAAAAPSPSAAAVGGASPATSYRMAYAAIGAPPALVSVPTHFWKAIIMETAPTAAADSAATYAIGAFVVPNAPIATDAPLAGFAVSLEALEAAAGVVLFQHLLPPFSASSSHSGRGCGARAVLAAAEAPWVASRSSLSSSAPDGAPDGVVDDADAAVRRRLPTAAAAAGGGATTRPRAPPPSPSPKRQLGGGAEEAAIIRHLCDARPCALVSERWPRRLLLRGASDDREV